LSSKQNIYLISFKNSYSYYDVNSVDNPLKNIIINSIFLLIFLVF